MHGVALLLTVAAIGVEYGWQPGEDGQLEYIIQIEPELVKTLSEGKVDLLSEIPEELQGVKRFRIRVGTGPVPRKGLEEGQAANVRPGDNVANQPPNLGGGQFQPNDPRSTGTRRPTDARGSPTPGRVLTPPGRDDQNPAQPADNDRFTDSSAGGNFPSVGRTPGIGRSASLPRDRNDPTEPLNDRTPVEYDAAGNPRPATNPAPTPVWDSATGQWRTPRSNTGTGTGTNNQPATNPNDPRTSQSQDPRYNNDNYVTNPRTGLPEVRRDTTQNPGPYTPYAPNSYPPTGYGPVANQGNQGYQQNQWGQPGYNGPPLRDPDPGYYPPQNYASRPAPQYDNRQVGYQVAANTGGNVPANPSVVPPAASTTATPTSATAVKQSPSLPVREPNVPYMPLTIVSMLFFASVGLNFYLGWIAHGIYQRYRALLMEVRNVRVATV